MRALAVLAVVAYHAGMPGISGGFVGVDFFFVLSGFLITSLLLAEHARTGTVSLRGFWAWRARRLLPASTLVLLATGLAAALWMPVLDRRSIAHDIGWSALFSANWRFAQQQTDYLAQDRTSSPVLHFWSLGVEEQFYVVWPLLVVAIGLLVARAGLRRHLRTAYLLVFALVVVVSFAWCLHQTGVSQPYAFFGTPARAWQLGMGALLAAAVPLLRLGRRTRVGLGLAGLAGYAVALVALEESGAGGFAYPGFLALLPSLAALALIAGGTDGPSGSPTLLSRALSIRPLQWLGDLSYSWYLWHWPVLVILPYAVGDGSWPWRVLAVALSLLAAWGSYVLVEQPLRRARLLVVRPWRSIAFGGALVALVAVPVTVLAAARTDGVVELRDGRTVTLVPNPAVAASDVFSMRQRGCDLDYEASELGDLGACGFGDAEGERSVVLLGDSHAVQVFPGLEVAARAEGWQLWSWTKSACPVADVTKLDRALGRAFEECDTFREAILDEVVEASPDLVVLGMASDNVRVVDRGSGEQLDARASREAVVAGLRSTVQRLTDAGVPVLMVADLPAARVSPPSCLVETGRVADCLVPARRGVRVEKAALAGIDGAELLDLRRGVCRDRVCTPVRGDTLVYRDTNHITRTYALTLAPRFRAVLARQDTDRPG
nr:acyltransferase family protein [Nocardioides sp. zg-DK7169]